MQVQIKLNYLQMKNMKKLYGKNLGTEIAIGRKLIRFMKMKYDQ